MEVKDDTISRQAAIDAAKDWYDGLIVGSFNGLLKRLKALPSAQPESIRCRDCKHWSVKTGLPYMSCTRGVMPTPMHTGNDFCSFAEKRE